MSWPGKRELAQAAGVAAALGLAFAWGRQSAPVRVVERERERVAVVAEAARSETRAEVREATRRKVTIARKAPSGAVEIVRVEESGERVATAEAVAEAARLGVERERERERVTESARPWLRLRLGAEWADLRWPPGAPSSYLAGAELRVLGPLSLGPQLRWHPGARPVLGLTVALDL